MNTCVPTWYALPTPHAQQTALKRESHTCPYEHLVPSPGMDSPHPRSCCWCGPRCSWGCGGKGCHGSAKLHCQPHPLFPPHLDHPLGRCSCAEGHRPPLGSRLLHSHRCAVHVCRRPHQTPPHLPRWRVRLLGLHSSQKEGRGRGRHHPAGFGARKM
jgi:hypothetical protein